MKHVRALRDRFWTMLKADFGARVVLNGHPEHRPPNALNVSFVGRIGAEILAAMPEVAASTGSTCQSERVELSPVLEAMGVAPEVGMGAIRFSLVTLENLLRKARRQKGAPVAAVPKVCLLNPDGDIVRQLQADSRARRHDSWVCYHTALFVFDEDGLTIGVVGCAVGASFAVLVAEELFASGCQLLISVMSSGQITPVQAPSYFILIDRAWRDEGTNYHYVPPADWSEAPARLLGRLDGAFEGTRVDVLPGPTWTTDAPFRETPEAIEVMRRRGRAENVRAVQERDYGRPERRPARRALARVAGTGHRGKPARTVSYKETRMTGRPWTAGPASSGYQGSRTRIPAPLLSSADRIQVTTFLPRAPSDVPASGRGSRWTCMLQ